MSATKFLDIAVTETLSRKASEAIAEGEGVKINAADHAKVDKCDTANELCIGIAMGAVTAQNITDGNDNLLIATAGRAKGLAGGAITLGAAITVDATGSLIVRPVVAFATLVHLIGFALTQAADGELFTLQIGRSQVWAQNGA